MKRERVFTILKTVLFVVAGNFLYAAVVDLFILPANMITGGATGIALIIEHFTRLDFSIAVAGLNGVLFFIGLGFLGKKFALTTLLSTFLYPLCLNLIKRFAGDFVLTTDPLLCAVFGGLIGGFAIALVISVDSRTGGMDIPPLILNKRFGVSVSGAMNLTDCAILLGQVVFSDRNGVLYGILLVFIYTITLDKCLAFGENKVRLEIISDRSEDIKNAIMTDVDRGVTLLHGHTGYLEREVDVVLCVVSPREVYRVERVIRKIDPAAFVVRTAASRVSGNGFTTNKRHLPERRGAPGKEEGKED